MTETKTKSISEPFSSEKEGSKEKKSPSNRKWLNIGSLLLILGIMGGGGWYWWQNKNNPPSVTNNQTQATGVKLATLTTSTIEDSTEFLGSLEAKKTVELNSEIEGRIVEILIKEGQTVKQGDTLFRLDSQTLQAQLNQAQATITSRLARFNELETGSRQEDIAAAKARLNQAQIRLANSRNGSYQAEIAQALAQLKSAEAEAQLAQQKVKRYGLLKEEGAISQDQFDNFLTESKTAEAKVDETQRKLEQLQQSTTSDIAQFQAVVEEGKQNLLLLQNGARKEQIAQAKADVQEAKANVQRIESLLDKTFIQAPIRGKIGNVPIKIGDYIENDDALTTITENNQLELSIAIPLEKASNLQVGLPVQILNGEKEIISTGKINFIESNVTSDSQLVKAKAIFNNLDHGGARHGTLLNRQFIKSRIIWNTTEGILVPSSAIFRIGGQAFVFTAEANPSTEGLIAKQKPITIGKIQGNNYQVLQGLENGDKILTAGILQVRDGIPIKEISETDAKKDTLK